MSKAQAQSVAENSKVQAKRVTAPSQTQVQPEVECSQIQVNQNLPQDDKIVNDEEELTEIEE